MQTSNRGVELIKSHEGLRLEAYADPGKGWAVPTIGYGHTSAAGPPIVTRGMKITAAEADAILRRDLGVFERAVASLIHVPLTQEQFDALVSFTFNLGPGNLKSSTLRRKLNAGDYQGAADEFLRWNKSAKKVLPGLTRRRAAERDLFLSGNTPPPRKPAMPKDTPTPAPIAQDRTGISTVPPWLFIVAFIVALAVAFIVLG